MHILVTNDDGIASPGLAVLARVGLAVGAEVTVAAPARESSGAAASLLGAEQDGRLLVDPVPAPDLPEHVPSFAVRAAPAMIAFVAAHGGFGPTPDFVLSGVNRGANTGHAVLHSGTVGAALSASTHGIRGLAVSLADARPQYWATAEVYAEHVLRWLLARQRKPNRVINLNVPDLPLSEVRGLRKAPLASFGTVQARIRELEHGNLMLTYQESSATQEPDSDAGLLARGWATVTLLHAPAFDPEIPLPESDTPLTTDASAP